MAESTSQAFSRASAAMQEQFAGITQGQRDFAEELARRTADAVATLDRHNAALEQELGRSRDNVAKVHGALVDMTGTLVTQVRAANA
jgi:phage shock protein A